MNSIKYSGDAVLDIISLHAPNRNRSIEKLIVKYLKLDDIDKRIRILEFGAGKGEFIRRFISRKNLELFAVEVDGSYLKNLSSIVKVFNSVDEISVELDCIYLIDVLEHLENDQFYLNQFYDRLKVGGRLFIYVPARMELYSAFDKKIGHFRRYTLKELRAKTMAAGFTIEEIRYHEFLGYGASWINKLIGNNGELIPSAVKLYDKFVVPLTNFIEKFIPAPIGKSIYLSAIRKEK